jgi:hypothetical protein
MHGYAARDGFGSTLIKNQMEAMNPVTINSHFGGILFFIFI